MTTTEKELPYKFGYVRTYESAKAIDDSETCRFTFDSDQLVKGEYYNVFLFNEKHGSNRPKRLVEASINLFVEATTQSLLSKSKKDYNSNLSENEIDLNFVHALREAGMLLGYLINSTSWSDQKLHDFDKFELINRVDKIKNHLR